MTEPELHLPSLPAEPLVSVTVVNFNYARFISDAIESVLAQTYQRFELVIVDDGSTDDSRDIIDQHAMREPRIRTVYKQNAGVAAALNDAFRATTGEIVSMLDADDLFETHKLERVVAAFARDGRAGMVMDLLTKVDADGHAIGKIPEFDRFDRGELREIILKTGGYVSAAPTSALSMRVDIARRVFPIPETVFRTEADAYMRTVAGLHGNVAAIDEPLTRYRVHSSNITASRTVNVAWAERSISAAERVYSVIADIAQQNGWRVSPIDMHPQYCEMQLVRACLNQEPLSTRRALAHNLQRAVENLPAANRARFARKARLVTTAAMLPLPVSIHLLEQIYLPTRLKTVAASAARALRR